MLKYLQIYMLFKRVFRKGRKECPIVDYHPCVKPFFDKDIPEGIIVWLSNGDRIIYIPRDDKDIIKQ